MNLDRKTLSWLLTASLLIGVPLGCASNSKKEPVAQDGATNTSDGSNPAKIDAADLVDALVDVDSAPGVSSDSGKKDRPADYEYLGSKCKTKCSLAVLMCDPKPWKGHCTHPCKVDADCQDTGTPGVCGRGNVCYRACTPVTNPCTRLQFECVGDPGRTYCDTTVLNPTGDAGQDDGGDGEPDSEPDGGGVVDATGN